MMYLSAAIRPNFLSYLTRMEATLDSWAYYAFMDAPSFGQRTSNRSESENSALKGRRGVTSIGHARAPVHQTPIGTVDLLHRRDAVRQHKLAQQLSLHLVADKSNKDEQEQEIRRHLSQKGGNLLLGQRALVPQYQVSRPVSGVYLVEPTKQSLEARRSKAAERIYPTVLRTRVVGYYCHYLSSLLSLFIIIFIIIIAIIYHYCCHYLSSFLSSVIIIIAIIYHRICHHLFSIDFFFSLVIDRLR